ncbi:MAG: peptidyl-prolyl cis-trans isomerase, EpsD family [Aquabacterium sp.]|jgi:EpsD family peptidyl-prolyl cis-trans isomerase|nr:MAG: peptidyl-prolyl cis-trans isomerase, EpsD family [Aquabacterium sp.]
MFGNSHIDARLQTGARKTQGRVRLATLLVSLVAGAAMLTACGGDKEKKSSQVAAKVNKEEVSVHQINFVLARQQGIKPEQKDQASKVILERLIDQELAFQKAQEEKIDRDPNVVQSIEAAKREIIVRKYFENVAGQAQQPNDTEIRDYFDKHPALFAQRRVYSFQEVTIEAKPEQVEGIKAKLATAKTVQEMLQMLQADGIRHATSQAVRAAEQLPLSQLDNFAQMKDGQVTISPTPPGLRVLILAGSENKPVTLEQAKPAIEAFLTNERKRQLIEAQQKSLRASAKIEYVGSFAGGPGAAASGAAPGLEPASEAASQ